MNTYRNLLRLAFVTSLVCVGLIAVLFEYAPVIIKLNL